jgi:hypothetical protein
MCRGSERPFDKSMIIGVSLAADVNSFLGTAIKGKRGKFS